MARPKSKLPGVVVFEKPKKINVDELKFDVKNIRSRHIMPKNQKEAEEFLWKMPDMELLYQDIRRQGLQEELILDGKNLVIEGNRRLAVCKRLFKEQSKGTELNHDFTKVFCKEFDRSVSELDKKAFLAQIHIAGKYEWDDFNQALLLTDLHERDKVTYDVLAAITRKSKPTIIKKIEAYHLIEEYHQEFKRDDNWSDKYPHMWELLKKDLKNIRDDPKKMKMFMRLLFDNRIPNSRDVRHLEIIFKDPKLLRALEQKGMKSTLEKIMESDPTVKSGTYKKIFNLTKLLQAFPTQEFVSSAQDKNKLAMLRELRNSADRLIHQLESVTKGK